MNHDMEAKLKSTAERYAENEGLSLLAEAEEMRLKNISYLTPRADKTVRGLMEKEQRIRRRKVFLGLAGAAACLALVFRLVTTAPDGGISSSAGGAMNGDAGAAPAETAPLPTLTRPAEILPISFALPADYQVTKADYDNGMSVYALESERHGDVVLTMDVAQDGTGGNGTGGSAAGGGANGVFEEGFADFDEIMIDGKSVPAKVQDAYKLLAFEKDGLHYTLSSEDDLGALAAFYRSIFV